jgi:hypothetical protein
MWTFLRENRKSKQKKKIFLDKSRKFEHKSRISSKQKKILEENCLNRNSKLWGKNGYKL